MTGGNRQKQFRGTAILSAFVGTMLLASGCSAPGQAAAPSPTATASATPVYVSSWVAPDATQLAPLRGTVVPAGSVANPAIAAKIDNHTEARPQVGLEVTDIIYEELVEGGITRYVAIWQSTIPDLLGPVRSIRPMDPDIISPYGGIVAYSGGQQRFVNLMRQTPVYNAIHGQSDTASTFFRTPDKEAPHNVLVKAREVVGQHSALAAPLQNFAYSSAPSTATAVADGTPASSLQLTFSTARYPSWTWAPDSQTWLRGQEGQPDLGTNGAQLAASNVVVVRVAIDNSLGVPKTILTGSGEATVATGGSVTAATWSKGGPTEPLRLVDAQGAAIRLAPGNTWIELVPVSGSVVINP